MLGPWAIHVGAHLLSTKNNQKAAFFPLPFPFPFSFTEKKEKLVATGGKIFVEGLYLCFRIILRKVSATMVPLSTENTVRDSKVKCRVTVNQKRTVFEFQNYTEIHTV